MLDPKHAFRQELYMRYYTSDADKSSPHYKSVFNGIDRLKLTVAIVEADEEIGGAGISTFCACLGCVCVCVCVCVCERERERERERD